MDKATYVQNLFTRIANNYDQLNDLMTFSMHKSWKQECIKHSAQGLKSLSPANRPNVLDLCTGTGDMAFMWTESHKIGSSPQVYGVDSCAPMLELARKKLGTKNSKTQTQIKFMEASALSLPFADNFFDAVTVGFGLRNLSDLNKGLQEIHRVLKPGAFVASLDLGHPKAPLVDSAYHALLGLIPFLGSVFAQDKSAYQYLVDSLKTWPRQEDLSQKFWDLGYTRSYYQDIMCGCIAIVVAQK